MQLKNKDWSKFGKLVIVTVAYGMCVAKWMGKLPSATVTEIWQCAAWTYGILLGTMDFNIIVDTFKGK